MSDRNEAFAGYWASTAPVVATYVHSMIPDFHQAQDLVQEVAIALFRKFEQYDPARPFVAWAIGMARNEVLNARRKMAKSRIEYRSELPEILSDVCVDMESELRSMPYALRECLKKVGPSDMRRLRMLYVDRMRPKAIAEREGKSPGAMRVLLFRIRRALEACVQRVLAAGEAQV